jgi:hypothetical protein
MLFSPLRMHPWRWPKGKIQLPIFLSLDPLKRGAPGAWERADAVFAATYASLALAKGKDPTPYFSSPRISTMAERIAWLRSTKAAANA